MARYTDDSRERVRDAVDFVDLVGSRVELRRAGPRRYEGLCPFHEERTPSFGIDSVEKLYHCFGCGAGGDLFKWVMELENLGFGEALELLADRYNVALEPVDEDPRAAERRQRRKRLLAVLERAAAYYVRLLWESPEAEAARAYLADRGLDEATARTFRVGYSPSGWDRLVVASQRAGFTAADLVAVGLAQRSRGASGLVDRFRGRLMFPWADERGRVLGFGARALSAEQQPKYLNTSETDVFHKGGQVYGADLARAEAARRGAVVLVEGYTDVLALHQAGVRHVVGQQGTALTADQAKALKRLASRVVLCLDGDAAGRQAMLKAAAVLRSAADVADVRVAALPPGSDPADLVQREGAETVSALLDRAVPFARWQVEHALASGDTGSAEGREALLAEAAAVIRPLAPGILREELVRMVADRLGLNDALIAASLAAAPSRRPAPVVVAPPARTTTRPPADDPAGPGTDIDALIAADPGREGDVLAPPSASSSNPALRALDRRVEIELAFLALCIAFPVAGAARLAEADLGALFSGAVVRRAAEHLREHAGSPSAELPPDDEPLAALIAELVVRAGRLDGAEPSELDRAALVLDLARLDRDIAAARASQAPVSDLAAERQRVLGEIRKVAV